MKKVLLVFLFGILLSGCEEDIDDNLNVVSSTPTNKFIIENHAWDLSLPTGWETLPVPQNSDAVFIAHSDSANFVVLKKSGTVYNLANSIIQSGKTKSYAFEEISFDENLWEFEFKPSPTLPLKHYIQKGLPVALSNSSLIGSCSFDASSNMNTNCKEIIESWEKE